MIQTYLAAHPCNRGTQKGIQGLVVARFAGFGQFRWQTRIAPSESSPVVVDGVVFLGDWSGRVYALFARTGKVKWVFRTKGRIKSGVAVSGNRVYVGSYDHHLYALNRQTGKLIWRASAQQRLGKRAQFYATPAAAYGRVYVGGDRREGLLVRRDDRKAPLVALDGQLRLRLARGLAQPRARRVVLAMVLRVRCRDRRRALAVLARTARSRAPRRSCAGSSTSRR